MWNSFTYNEPVFRPPGEASSVILQVTYGCSWNKCAFCDMYTSKKFSIRNLVDIENDIRILASMNETSRKFFLADGNAMVLPTNTLLTIIELLKKYFPKLTRVSAYALPRDIYSKTDNELQALQNAGLKLLYVGVESGDANILQMINKSETPETTIQGLLKAKQNGIKSSVMILNGLGGKTYSKQHAIGSAMLLNETQPELLSVLVLSFPFGVQEYHKRFKGEFIQQQTPELLQELFEFIQHTNLQGTIFRSDHASNYLPLEGVLGRDKDKLLSQIDFVLHNPNKAHLRQEWQRGL